MVSLTRSILPKTKNSTNQIAHNQICSVEFGNIVHPKFPYFVKFPNARLHFLHLTFAVLLKLYAGVLCCVVTVFTTKEPSLMMSCINQKKGGSVTLCGKANWTRGAWKKIQGHALIIIKLIYLRVPSYKSSEPN